MIPRAKDPPDWQEILKYFRGSELQNYFTRVLEDNLKALIKPQYVDHIPKMIKVPTTVDKMLGNKEELDNKDLMCKELELNEVLQRDVTQLSGGELQRFAIAMSCVQRAHVCVDSRLDWSIFRLKFHRYMFDEPSSYLDVKQRLKAAAVIRSLLTPDNYVIAVEHDLSVLDYLSDFICCLYGKPSMYGVVTMPYSVREGAPPFSSLLGVFLNSSSRRYQHLLRRFRSDREPAIQRGVPLVQDGRNCRGDSHLEISTVHVPSDDQDPRKLQADRFAGQLHRLGNCRYVGRKWNRKNNIHPPPGWRHPRCGDGQANILGFAQTTDYLAQVPGYRQVIID